MSGMFFYEVRRPLYLQKSKPAFYPLNYGDSLLRFSALREFLMLAILFLLDVFLPTFLAESKADTKDVAENSVCFHRGSAILSG